MPSASDRRNGPFDRKPVIVVKAEGVAALAVFFDFREHVVGKREQLRNRAEALGDGAARVAIGAQLVDERASLVHDGHVGVAKSVNRLLAIAHEEDRRNERSALGETAALAPRTDEQRDQAPLRAARVLELVEQHMVIPALEAISAARELVHLRKQ